MKTLTLKQLLVILAFYKNGQTDFKKKLTAYPRSMRRLFKLESNPDNTLTESSEVYQYAYEEEGYNKAALTTLRSQLREALTDFLELQILRNSAEGQNLRADFYEQHGQAEKANKANKKALRIAKDEAEHKRWLSSFQAHKALYFRGGKEQLEKTQQNLLLFFLISFLKLTNEQLTVSRIKDNKRPVDDTIIHQTKKVLKLLPALKPPIIEILTKTVKYYEDQNFETYEAFKTKLFQKVDLIASDKKYLLISLLNAVALYPNPSEKTLREYLPIYKEAIEKELFSYNGELKTRTVCNVLLVSDLHKDYELIKLARKKLIPLLPEEKERIWCLLLADIYLLFGTKKYNLALDKIKQLDNENCRIFDVTFRKNILRLKCCFDMSETSVDAYLNIGESKRNFEKLLQRNFKNQNIDSLTKLRCTNFIKFLMMVCNTQNKKYTKTYLVEKLASYKEEITETEWLKNKIAERPF